MATERSLPDRLAYCDYAALLCYFDDSTWIRMGSSATTPLPPTFGQFAAQSRAAAFARSCRSYRKQVADNYRGMTGEEAPLSPALYNPACFLAFGHSDTFGLAIVDDAGPLLTITADVAHPVEQALLAFCPTCSSLGLEGDPLFAELEPLLQPGNPSTVEEALPPALRPFPLVAVTRYKLNGQATLGQGLWMQAVVYRAMARRIRQTLADLKEHQDRQPVKGLIRSEDLEAVRCVFLDPQGSEEIATLIFCTNYSVALAVINAVRNLTFAEILENKELKKALEVDGMHAALLIASQVVEKPTKKADDPKKVRIDADLDLMSGNHLFSKTYTTLGAAHQAFEAPERSGVWGYVEAYSLLDINPGHLLEVENRLLRSSSPPMASPSTLVIRRPAREFHRFLVGRHDFTLTHNPVPGEHEVTLLPLAQFFLLLRGLYQQLGCHENQGQVETGLLDVSTSLVIPFPCLKRNGTDKDLLLTLVNKEKHRPIMPTLEAIRARLFHRSEHAENERNAPDFRGGALDVTSEERLAQMRQLGLPFHLRRTILYLYQLFAHSLAEPYLYDGVLDLYDAFATLHRLLFRSPKPAGIFARSAFLQEEEILELVDVLGGLHNALLHRISLALPHIEGRDTAVDFRGGLNKLVATADVPLRCGLGLLKRLLPNDPTARPLPGQIGSEDRVAAVASITFLPGIRISRSRPGDPDRLAGHRRPAGESPPVWLAHVSMDVGHAFNPEEYISYIHEAAHLLQDHTAPQHRGEDQGRRGGLSADALDEISVEMLTHLFVFGADRSLYLTRLLAVYNLHPVSNAPTPARSLLRFVELLLRSFFVTDPIRALKDAIQNVFEVPTDQLTYCPGKAREYFDEARTRFLALVDRYAGFSPEYRLLNPKQRQAFHKYCAKRFRKVFLTNLREVRYRWEQAIQLFRQLANLPDMRPWGKEGSRWREQLAAEVERSLAVGQPIIRSQLFAPNGTSLTLPGEEPDSFFLVCRLLYSHLRCCYGELSVERGLHVPRSPGGREVRFDQAEQPKDGWNDFLLDPPNPGLFSAHPAKRRERLRHEIVVLKSLWDLSTVFRARRLKRILADNWPEVRQFLDSHAIPSPTA